MEHPLVKITDATISSNQTQVELAEQAYTPQFGVEVMYAHRQANNMAGEPASDLVSAYLTVDIPLFTGTDKTRICLRLSTKSAQQNPKKTPYFPK